MATSDLMSEENSMSESPMNSMPEIVISKGSANSIRARSNITKISRDAGRMMKQSAIPNIVCWITVKILDLLRILEDSFSLYDKTLFILQYLSQVLLFVSTVGITATIEFLRAYHEVIFLLSSRLKEIISIRF